MRYNNDHTIVMFVHLKSDHDKEDVATHLRVGFVRHEHIKGKGLYADSRRQV